MLLMHLFLKILRAMANSVDPDQTAPERAVWSGSALFAYVILSETLVFEFLGHLPYMEKYGWNSSSGTGGDRVAEKGNHLGDTTTFVQSQRWLWYMHSVCILCSYATCVWPEFIFNKDMFCSASFTVRFAHSTCDGLELERPTKYMYL